MNPKRKAVEEYLYKYLDGVDPSGLNLKKYKETFSKMSDQDFDAWMHYLKDGEDVLSVEVPNLVVRQDIDKLTDLCKALGIQLFTRLKLWDEPTQSYYTTTNDYIMLKLPIRRQSQFLDHKLSVPEGDSKIDNLSGQVIKPDQANSLCQTEVQALYARGLNATIMELIKYRGGDVSAFAEYKRSLEEQGHATIANDTNSITRAVVIFDVFFSGMQLKTNAAG